MARELPTVFEAWSTVRFPHRCDGDFESLMGAAPFVDPEGTTHDLQVVREALVDCLELLGAEDRFVLEAIWFERITVRVLASRLGLQKSRAAEIGQQALGRLGVVAAEHPVFARFVA